MVRIGRFCLSALENSRKMGDGVTCGDTIRKRESDRAIADNRGYVKRDNSGLLGGQIADGAATAESKFISLIT